LVRDAFDLAKEKIKEGNRKGAIIFIDELDAIGKKKKNTERECACFLSYHRTICSIFP
jgi:26S proteasome regulatory subunit T5